MPATRVLSNGHEVEELLYVAVRKSLLYLLTSHEMRTDDINVDWPNVPVVRALWIQCVDSGRKRKMDEASIRILSNACLCNSNGYIPENIRNIVLSITVVRKNNWGGNDHDKERVYMSIPPLYTAGPADPAGHDTEIDLGDAPQF